MSGAPRGIGDNQPPGPLPLIETAGLLDDLKRDWAHLLTSSAAVKAMGQAWLDDHPTGVADAADQAQATDVLGKLLSEIDVIDKDSSRGVRSEVVKPLNEAVRIVNGFFKITLADPLREVAANINRQMLVWANAEKKRRDDEARKQQQEAVRKQQAEAEQRRLDAQKLAELAQDSGDDAALDAAILAEQAAMEAVDIAPPPPTAPSTARVYGDHNTSSNLTGTWKVRVVDAALVPLQYKVVSETLLEAAMKTSRSQRGKGPPTIKIPGVEFYQETRLNVKR